MPAINPDTKVFWQTLVDRFSRQRPNPGKVVTIIRGKKLLGQKATVIRHQIDKFDTSTYRYGSDASHHMRDLEGRSGWVCLIETDDGDRAWIKAKYLMCEWKYSTWYEALVDAISIGR